MPKSGVGLACLSPKVAGAGLGAKTETPEAGRAALERALGGALDQVGSADSALVFVTPGGVLELPEILELTVGVLGTEAVVGATCHGVMAGGHDLEGVPAVSVLVQSGVEAEPFLISDLQRDGASVGEEIAAHLGGSPRSSDLVILLPDPHAFDPGPVLDGIRDALGSALVVGAGAGDPVTGRPQQWMGSRLESGALAGMILRLEKSARIGVTQACRPVTDLLTVTRAQGNWIVELDGRPALEVYAEVARAPLAEDLRRAAAYLLVALPRGEEDPLRPGGYLVRNVVGFSAENAAFAIPEVVTQGMQIALATREPEAAREDLKAMLDGVTEGGAMGDAAGGAGFGLYFNCCARGVSFFGVPGLEAAYLDRALGKTPLMGMYGSCEIGPIGTTDPSTELLTYTGVLALIEG